MPVRTQLYHNMRTVLFVVLLFAICSNGLAQNARIDSLRNLLSTDITEKQRVSVLLKLVNNFNRISTDSVTRYATTLEDLIEGKSYHFAERSLMNVYAIRQFSSGNTDSAIYYFEQAIEVSKREGAKMSLAYAYSNAGAAYARTGQFEKALAAFIEASKAQEDIPDYPLRARISTIMNIGTLNSDLRNPSEARKYFHKARVLVENKKEYEKEASIYYNLATVHRDERPDSAIFYLKKSMELSESHGFTGILTSSWDILGHTYFNLDQPDSGIFYLTRAIEQLEKVGGDNRQLAGALSRLGSGYIEIKQYRSSLRPFEKAITLYEQLNDPTVIPHVLRGLATAQNALGMSSIAFDNLMRSRNLEDSIYKAQTSESLNEMQTKYETDKKNQQIALQESQLETNAAIISRQTLIRNIAIGGAAVLVLVVVLIYRNNRLKTRASREIAVKNDQLGKALNERESLLKEIHHRVKNNLQVIAGLLYLQSDKTDDVDVKELLEEGQGRVRSMALIHQKLYENEDLKHIPFEEYLSELVGEIKKTFGSAAEGVELLIDAKNIQFDVDTAVPLGLIINELSTNAFKYAYTGKMGGAMFSVKLEQNEGQYEMTVSDNGAGIPDEALNNGQSASLGLRLTRMLSDQLEGDYEFDNVEGTSFKLKFAV